MSLAVVASSFVDSVTPPPAPTPLSRSVLRVQGALDGGRIYNGAAFIQNNIWTDGTDVYVSGVNYQNAAVVRRWDGTSWTSQTVWTGVPDDLHDSIQVAVAGGQVHVVGGVHDGALQMYSSSDFSTWNPRTIAGLSTSTTYPTFVRDGDDLLLFVRTGASGAGGMQMARYDAATNTWGSAVTVISGVDKSPYWWRIANRDGVLRVAFTWRDNATTGNNTDLHYAESSDGGATWQDSTGTTYTLPIVQATAEVIYTGTDFINSGGADVDSNGRLHAVLLQDDPVGAATGTNVVHVYQTAGGWASEVVTKFSEILGWQAGIGNQSISRPAVVCPAAGGTHLIYRRDTDPRLHVIDISTPGSPGAPTLLLDYQVGDYELTYDQVAAEDNDSLRFMVVASKEGGDSTWNGRYGYVLTTPLSDIGTEFVLHDDPFAQAVYGLAAQPTLWARLWDDRPWVEDDSGNGRVGSSQNLTAQQPSLLASGDGTSYHFDGTAYATIPDDNAFDGVSSLSLFARVRTSASGQQRHIVSRDNSGTTARSFHFRINANGTVTFVRIAGTIVNVTTTATINDGATHSVGATYNGATVTVYIDGAAAGSAACTGSIGSISLPLQIGHYVSPSGRDGFWLGDMQEAIAWSGAALSAADHASLHAAAVTA